ncbi:hypothetical protein M8818_004639 [Zalaria obscura]|uniref:Uncharacterized protein n=1 Tax=Zalaria obscura TaxID=2024903 RepID=A0ACC3SCK7_9PEZI
MAATMKHFKTFSAEGDDNHQTFQGDGYTQNSDEGTVRGPSPSEQLLWETQIAASRMTDSQITNDDQVAFGFALPTMAADIGRDEQDLTNGESEDRETSPTYEFKSFEDDYDLLRAHDGDVYMSGQGLGGDDDGLQAAAEFDTSDDCADYDIDASVKQDLGEYDDQFKETTGSGASDEDEDYQPGDDDEARGADYDGTLEQGQESDHDEPNDELNGTAPQEVFNTHDEDEIVVKREHTQGCGGSPGASTPGNSRNPSSSPGHHDSATSDVQDAPSKPKRAIPREDPHARAMRHHKNFHQKAKLFKPVSKLDAHRYWVGVLLLSVRRKEAKREKDFLWFKANRKTTVETIWQYYKIHTASEGFELRLADDTPGFNVQLEELNHYNDNHVFFEAVHGGSVNAPIEID